MDISKELANANKIVPASATADSSPMGTMQTTDWAAGGNKKAIPNTTYEFDPYASSSSSTNTSSCLLYTSPSPRDGLLSRMPSSA